MGVECMKENPPVSLLFTLSCRRMVCVSGVPTLCASHMLRGLSHSDLAAWGGGLSSFPFPTQGESKLAAF